MSIAVRSLVLLVLAGGLIALPGGSASAEETVTIAVGDIWFCDSSFLNGVCETTITAGDTVAWDFGAGFLPHTTTDCGADCDNPSSSPLWDSDIITDDSTYSRTFSEPGAYLYLCTVHPIQMRGRIIVEAAAVETPTGDDPTPDSGTSTPDGDAAGDTADTIVPPADGLPVAPGGGSGASTSAIAVAAAAAGALAVGLGGAGWHALRRR